MHRENNRYAESTGRAVEIYVLIGCLVVGLVVLLLVHFFSNLNQGQLYVSPSDRAESSLRETIRQDYDRGAYWTPARGDSAL